MASARRLRFRRIRHTACACGLAAMALAASAWGLEDAAGATPLPEVLVIGTSPVPGLKIDADKVPGNTQTLTSQDLSLDGVASIITGISYHLSSVNINDTLADPFQPDIVYRGFEASPVLGTPQGLAVYQNGVRINEAFGDTVNWDLFPDIAIDRVDLVSANPLFGLNALGGALSVSMKNGFTHQGADGSLSGGSFNQRQGEAEFGWNNGEVGFYAAGRMLDQNGWRFFAHDSIHQYYAGLSLHEGGLKLDLSYTRADNRLYGQGEAPVQSLDIDHRNVFTGPQNNFNTLDFVTLNASYDFTGTLGLQSVLYSRNFRQSVANGDNSDYTGCTGTLTGSLCQGDGVTPLTQATGALIPDLTNGGATIVGKNDYENIHSTGQGASLQLTATHLLLGHGNVLGVGATYDTAKSNFYSGTIVGVLNSALTVLPTPYQVYTPGNAFDSNGEEISATPVNLDAQTKYYGFYATDTFDLTSALSITASARYNIAQVDLTDLGGEALTGNNRYTHLNPALGATYEISPAITAFAGWSTNNRAPTPSEIECSDPTRPCLLPSSLAGDPPTLRQVIAHTSEIGLRGHVNSGDSQLAWNASAFRTNLSDDIYGISTSISTGFFQNIGSTRRQGFEGGLNYRTSRWSAYLQYSYVDATFRSALMLNSPSNPHQDANGNIQVEPGDLLPLIPRNRIKVGGDYTVLPHWTAGASVVWVGSEFYKGDESNQNPQLPGYHPVTLRTSYQVTKHVQLFANVQNLFNEYYSTVGLYSDPTGVNAPGVPPDAQSNGPGVDNRFQSPAMPRSYFGGIQLTF